jgi:AcrR family transcriptional regulator
MDATAAHECQPAGCEDTRERILLASQKLFADKGFDATSVRDITTEAGCNVASVNYHFGGKDNLYLETFRSMLAVLRDQRLSVLDELMGRTPPPTLEEFLQSFAEGFIDPLVDESRGRLFILEKFGPPLDPADSRLCIMSMVGQLLHALKAHHLFTRADHSAVMPTDLADYIPHFVRYSVGGIRAFATVSAREE